MEGEEGEGKGNGAERKTRARGRKGEWGERKSRRKGGRGSVGEEGKRKWRSVDKKEGSSQVVFKKKKHIKQKKGIKKCDNDD